MRIDGARIQQLAGRIDHGHLGTGAKTGVDAQHGLAGQWRLTQQGAEVGGKDLDGVAVRLSGQFAAHVALDGGQQQALSGILDGYLRARSAERANDVLFEFVLDRIEPVTLSDVHPHFQHAFFFTTAIAST